MNDITTVTHGVVLQQVNCKGVMGCGVALAIRNTWPIVYERYRKHIKHAKLGKIQVIKINAKLFVINLFAQDAYGRNQRHTDYNALYLCLEKVYNWWDKNCRDLPIYLPYKMGCSNAGGDWKIVYNMIKQNLPAAQPVHPPIPKKENLEQRFKEKITRIAKDLQKTIVS